MEDTPKYRLHASLGYHLSLAARIQERRLDDWLRPLGLTRTTWCILLAVENERLTRPSAIAEFVGIDRTATSRALRQMEDAGLILRSAAATDRRMTDVALSERGRNLVALGTPLAEENNRLIAEKLSEADVQELRRLLNQIISGELRDLARL